MIFKHKLGAASVLAAAWYSAAAAAADYNTRIYSVTVDEQNGTLKIDGVDLVSGGAPATAHVELLGQTLQVREAESSSTHVEAALPEGISLNPGTGYQLYVSPNRGWTSAATSPADQAFFTLYVSSRVSGARIAAGNGGSRAGGPAPALTASGSSHNASTNVFESLGKAFSINPHSTTNVQNGAVANDGSSFSLPYTGSLGSTSNLFSLTNTGTGDAIDGVSTSTASNAVAIRGVMSSTSSGTLSAAVRGINSGTSTVGVGVWGSHDGGGAGVFGTTVNGYGVRGTASGNGVGVLANSNNNTALYAQSNTGVAGLFSISSASSTADNLWVNNAAKGRGIFLNNSNTSSTASAMQVTNAGTGSSAYISNTNANTTANVIYATGVGPGVISDHTQGNVADFVLNNTNSVGAGVRGETNSIFGNPGTAGVYGTASGTGGYGGYFDHTNSTGFGLALLANTVGQGPTAQFSTQSGAGGGSGNSASTVVILQNANGSGLNITTTSPTGSGTTPNTANALYVTTNGPGVIADHTQGNAGSFFANNTSGVGAGVRGEVNSIFGNNGTAGVYGSASGTGGYGGYFDHTNSQGFGLTLYAITQGAGTVANFVTPSGAGNYSGCTSSCTNSQPTLLLQQNANGNGLSIQATSPTASGTTPNTSNIVNVTFDGPGVIADHSQGNVANFVLSNTTSVGAGVRGETNSIFGNAGTAGVYGVASGTGGYAGYFAHTDTSGFGTAVMVQTEDQGTAMIVNQNNGSTGDPVIFQAAGANVARIDRTGKGFFDGGTATGGADLAEFVPTIGAVPQVGDVVEIDPEHPNSFRLCAEANTTRVAGIISTAPGVTLNAKDGSKQAVSGPALALAGRVPTKVNDQNGAIHIGDLLVASSEPGRAMRAPAHPEPGTVIGKALQDSDAAQDTVEVLVMLR